MGRWRADRRMGGRRAGYGDEKKEGRQRDGKKKSRAGGCEEGGRGRGMIRRRAG